ncbi:transcriptional regulator, TetR family [Amycolatopsis marina]|uniref:Transcriptional regulator, TetR family n=1 Tax=Amycolatopsis marina TaxID=490629 RepID=A0A1I0WXS9_9PSEU|nr:TetR/AcrR family transcriptional regulator [Amycolatopsis marina]SFA93207.1 transcriptional regulator, TetR family [Amycolatopsis marina]
MPIRTAHQREQHDQPDRSGQDGRATRWRGQHDRRRAQFVDAALRAIAEHGADVSTEQIAEQAGVARTRLYKHFTDAGELQRAIAQRAAAMITEELEPVWNPQGTPAQMIATAVDTHLRWLTEHSELHRYLTRHALTTQAPGTSGCVDVQTAIGVHLTGMFHGYLSQFGLDPRPAETVAFGIVGYVESATTRWLESEGTITQDELAGLLTSAIWTLLDMQLRIGGVELDPDRPLPPLSTPAAPSAERD